MQRGINKVILIGNVGGNPDVYGAEGKGKIVSVSLATSESWKDAAGVEQNRTEWHRVKFFGKLGEIVAKYVTKGVKIYVEGSLRSSKWKDKEGVERTAVEVIANTMQILDPKRDASKESTAKQYASASGNAEFDEDIPF